MQPYSARPASAVLDNLVMTVFPAASDVDNTFDLYEDDGISLDYKDGKYRISQLNYSQKGNTATVTVNPAKGNYEGAVAARAYTLRLPALAEKAEVRVNGKKSRVVMVDGVPTVNIPKTSVNRPVKVTFQVL